MRKTASQRNALKIKSLLTLIQSRVLHSWSVPFSRDQQRLTASDFIDNQFFRHAMSQPLTNATLLIELSLQQKDHQTSYTKIQLRQALAQLKHLQQLFKLGEGFTDSELNFNLQQALNELAHRHHHPQESKIVTSIFQLPSNPKIWGNQFLFQEALTCLFNNAYESYTATQKSKYVLLAAYEKKDRVIIYLGDTGSGINWAVQHLMKIKGFTLKKTGHGLGVAYAQRIIRDHLNGDCKLVSHPDIGSIYMISIPIKP